MTFKADWLLRAGAESFLMVASILLALAVDEWREDVENDDLAAQSLRIFEQEIRRNLARVQDVAPFHAGLLDVVVSMGGQEVSPDALRSVTAGIEPTVLLDTAWETALATGALTYIDFEVVRVLSLTYSLQERFLDQARTGVGGAPGSGRATDTAARVAETEAYLMELTSAERELEEIYRQALSFITDRTGTSGPRESPPPGESGGG